ncbi:MAG: ATP-binding protein [Methylococcaceae bacterium]|nr:MAG: ATP-binding protein [Methylococcaceae bacterium]
MVDNAARVNRVVENILQLSRRGAAQCMTLELGEWLAAFLDGFCQTRNLEQSPFDYRRPALPVRIVADAGQLQQILENLCDNALKYGHPEHGKIDIRVICRPKDMKPCIEVEDHGPGIAPQLAEQIFEPFYTSSPTGTGLGLYISRELAELNQARLSYEPSPAGGGFFRLCLCDAEMAAVAW